MDLDGRRISVKRSWDDREGEIDAQDGAGTREAPLPQVLYRLLAAHKLRSRRAATRTSSSAPSTACRSRRRTSASGRSWSGRRPTRSASQPPQLNPISLHELRHTAISLWFAAGVRRETCEDWAGHSSGRITDIYRHLRPEVFEAELAQVNEYLAEGCAAVAVGGEWS